MQSYSIYVLDITATRRLEPEMVKVLWFLGHCFGVYVKRISFHVSESSLTPQIIKKMFQHTLSRSDEKSQKLFELLIPFLKFLWWLVDVRVSNNESPEDGYVWKIIRPFSSAVEIFVNQKNDFFKLIQK